MRECDPSACCGALLLPDLRKEFCEFAHSAKIFPSAFVRLNEAVHPSHKSHWNSIFGPWVVNTIHPNRLRLLIFFIFGIRAAPPRPRTGWICLAGSRRITEGSGAGFGDASSTRSACGTWNRKRGVGKRFSVAITRVRWRNVSPCQSSAEACAHPFGENCDCS